MVGTKPMPQAAGLSEGVGEVNGARSLELSSPPKANNALNAFVVSNPITGGKSFAAASWAAKAKTETS